MQIYADNSYQLKGLKWTHHVAHSKYLTILLVSYTSEKLEKKNWPQIQNVILIWIKKNLLLMGLEECE